MGIVFSHHPLLQWGWMEISIHSHGFGGYLWSWRIFVQDTPPKYSIYGQPKVKADSWLGWKVKADPLTWPEGQGHCHIWKNVLLEGQGWSPDPPCLSAHSLQSDLKICWNNTKPMTLCLVNHIYQNLNKIKWEIQLDSSWNSVFYGHR